MRLEPCSDSAVYPLSACGARAMWFDGHTRGSNLSTGVLTAAGADVGAEILYLQQCFFSLFSFSGVVVRRLLPSKQLNQNNSPFAYAYVLLPKGKKKVQRRSTSTTLLWAGPDAGPIPNTVRVALNQWRKLHYLQSTERTSVCPITDAPQQQLQQSIVSKTHMPEAGRTSPAFTLASRTLSRPQWQAVQTGRASGTHEHAFCVCIACRRRSVAYNGGAMLLAALLHLLQFYVRVAPFALVSLLVLVWKGESFTAGRQPARTGSPILLRFLTVCRSFFLSQSVRYSLAVPFSLPSPSLSASPRLSPLREVRKVARLSLSTCLRKMMLSKRPQNVPNSHRRFSLWS